MVKLLVMDVDGTLTDGKLHIGNSGECFKSFHVRDGYGIHDMLPAMGVKAAVITGRTSQIVKRRCEELDIPILIQGSVDKVQALQEVLDQEKLSWSEVAYIGDDINDFPCMLAVKEAGGIIGCPYDAARQVQEICNFITRNNGGNGAVREFIEWMEEVFHDERRKNSVNREQTK